MENGEHTNVSVARFRRRILWSLVLGFVAGAVVGGSVCQNHYRSLLKSIRCHDAVVQVVDAASGEPLPIITEYVQKEDSDGFPREECTTAHSMSEFEIGWIGTQPTWRVRVSSDGYAPQEITLDSALDGKHVVKLQRQGDAPERR